LQPVDPDDVHPQAQRRAGAPYRLMLDDEPAEDIEVHPWAELARRVLADGSIASFCQLLRTRRDDLHEESLPELAAHLSEQLTHSSRPLAAT
jgi:hypothetical protein